MAKNWRAIGEIRMLLSYSLVHPWPVVRARVRRTTLTEKDKVLWLSQASRGHRLLGLKHSAIQSPLTSTAGHIGDSSRLHHIIHLA